MAKSNKDDIVNGIIEYKLIESAVKLGSAAKEDAKRNGTYEVPGGEIIRAFAAPKANWCQWGIRIGLILLPIIYGLGLYWTFHGI